MNLAAHLISDEERSPILGLQLNCSSTSFATATDQGWAVYRTHPLQRTSQREYANGSLRFVLPLELSNIIFLVGGPPSPLYSPNKVMVWDDHLGQAVCELEFREEVKGLAARKDRLVVVLKKRVVLFVLGKGGLGIWREGVYETTNNPKGELWLLVRCRNGLILLTTRCYVRGINSGLVALGTELGSTLLAFPGRQPGQVQIVHLPPLAALYEMPPLPPAPSHDPTSAPYPSVSIILAHTTSLAALSCTPSGALLATASSKGTLIRVWDTTHARLVKELRRGLDEAEVFGIAIRKDGEAVAVSSDKGTVHVWDLKMTKEEHQKKKRSASASSMGEAVESTRSKQFSMLKPYLPKYFSSEWSHSQFRLPPPAPTASRLPFSLSSSTAAAAGASAASSGVASGSTAPPTIEDDVCICAWIEVEVDVAGPDATGPSSTTLGRSDSKRPNKPATMMGVGSAHPRSIPNPLGEKRIDHQIVALTHSGRWFRISLLGGGGGGGEPGTRETSKAAKDDAFGLGRDSTTDCRLEEYRQFGKKDGW
ncbi:BQ2448_956 [Microbotryum intermedium]|uniref:BQ2448_956 protein n=1 Tax=Microbotryum intermedium TaxID=269621 RepID=A0A238F6M5_9BASI|nr:BQ2448_956 [Microbotryum intermedium]